ncbi:hypothetical protein K490DRAFT_63180 [Saccharata proteae CBS 121410]|uniref:Uncharacterized protein n=1 Tax=Saccharata proteae CBS 121410 TaxID=1314787 RepID=A0A9P4I0I6_9PEZI|nr:hypothetical protein K490DRAFT_63180 [Saccharata proteae CBS 121410]
MDNIEFSLRTALTEVAITDLPAEERYCPICQNEYGQETDISTSEHPHSPCPLCRQPLLENLDQHAINQWVQNANVHVLSGLGDPDRALRALEIQLPLSDNVYYGQIAASGIQIRMFTYGEDNNPFLRSWDNELIGYRYEEWDPMRQDGPDVPSWTGLAFRYLNTDMLPRWIFLPIPIENGMYRLHPDRYQIGPEDLLEAPPVLHSLRRPIDPTPRPNATGPNPALTWDSRLNREQILIVDAHRMSWHLCWLTQNWRFDRRVNFQRSDRRDEAVMVRLCIARAAIIRRLRELNERMMGPNLLRHILLEAAALAINQNAGTYRRHAEEQYVRELAVFAPEHLTTLVAASPRITALQVLPGPSSDAVNAIYEAVNRILLTIISEAIEDSRNDFPGENLYQTYRANPELQEYLATEVPAFSGDAVPEVLLQTPEARGARRDQGIATVPIGEYPDVAAPLLPAVTHLDDPHAETYLLRMFGVAWQFLD